MSIAQAYLGKNWQKIVIVLFLIIFVAGLVAYAYIGTYSRFMADDYGYATIARSKGIIGSMVHWYLSWTGRFSASYLDGIFGSIGPGITPYVPPFVIAMWLIVLMAYKSSILASITKEPQAII